MHFILLEKYEGIQIHSCADKKVPITSDLTTILIYFYNF